MDYGKNIKNARKAAGLTQAQLAKLCDMATITIQQYESGKREPRREQLQIMATALGTEPWKLMGFDGIQVPMPEYPIQMPTEEQFSLLSPPEQEYVSLRVLADTAPDILEKRYMENYNQLNKLGKVEAVKRVEELTEIPRYRRPESPPPTPAGTDTPAGEKPAEGA